MAEDNGGKLRRDALEHADKISQIAIFWGLIIAVVAIAFAMMKGLFW